MAFSTNLNESYPYVTWVSREKERVFCALAQTEHTFFEPLRSWAKVFFQVDDVRMAVYYSFGQQRVEVELHPVVSSDQDPPVALKVTYESGSPIHDFDDIWS